MKSELKKESVVIGLSYSTLNVLMTFLLYLRLFRYPSVWPVKTF